MFERLGGKEVRAAAEARWRNPTAETRAEYVRLCYPFYLRRPPPAGALQRMRANPAMWAHFEATPREVSTVELLGRVSCPTLVLAGEDDPVTPVEQARQILDALTPGLGRLEIFPDCAHGLHIEDQVRFLAAMRGFLAEA